MKLLSDLLYKAGIDNMNGTTNLAISSVCFDSRKVGIASVFVATRGTQVDGHNYIETAIEKGAVAVVCEEFPTELNEKITYIKVKDSSFALGIIASNFYDQPSSKIKLVGVTGTNGKTTTVSLLFLLYRSLGKKVGLLSTVKNQINGEVIPSTHTTGDAVEINRTLAKMVEEDCKYCFMEVSSHAIHQNRIAGLEFDLAIFSNLSHDHLDYHKTFDEYILAKKKFFDDLSSDAIALINSDEKHGSTMINNTQAKVYSYGLRTMADFKCRIIENTFAGLQLEIDGQEVWSRLIGTFNAYNLLAVYAAAILLQEEKIQALTSLSNLSSVEGRFQYFKSEQNTIAIVDYAHTPDALKKVLDTIGDIREGAEKVITVVGCGGDRDKEKRSVMAKIACRLSDQVILTSDNPRSENPEAIINDMKIGLEAADLKKVLSITDRFEAIKTACMLSGENDIVLVAGKGHEKYQDIKGVKHPFDDKETLEESFKMLGK
ncbi:MAG: UDP-N-acetylmuramoyl-L-alanyl-D-glutamate--2,6-diaminopimelate ligase [Glaciecola sp.]|jgi:UDP-N-acetylmuramoyl-L-alanyl-D-glutamate--2,6-diaminopimelate ligase